MILKIWKYRQYNYQLWLNIVDTTTQFIIKEFTNEIELTTEYFDDIELAIEYVYNSMMGHDYDDGYLTV